MKCKTMTTLRQGHPLPTIENIFGTHAEVIVTDYAYAIDQESEHR